MRDKNNNCSTLFPLDKAALLAVWQAKSKDQFIKREEFIVNWGPNIKFIKDLTLNFICASASNNMPLPPALACLDLLNQVISDNRFDLVAHLVKIKWPVPDVNIKYPFVTLLKHHMYPLFIDLLQVFLIQKHDFFMTRNGYLNLWPIMFSVGHPPSSEEQMILKTLLEQAKSSNKKLAFNCLIKGFEQILFRHQKEASQLLIAFFNVLDSDEMKNIFYETVNPENQLILSNVINSLKPTVIYRVNNQSILFNQQQPSPSTQQPPPSNSSNSYGA